MNLSTQTKSQLSFMVDAAIKISDDIVVWSEADNFGFMDAESGDLIEHRPYFGVSGHT